MTAHLAHSAPSWAGRPAVRDAALAVALLLAGVVVAGADETLGDSLLHDAPWWLATALAVAGVALRRRRPFLMLGLCCAAAVIHLTGSVSLTLIDLSVPILLYTIAVRHGWAVSLVVLSGLLLLALGSSAFAVNRIERAPLPGAGLPVHGPVDVPPPPRPDVPPDAGPPPPVLTSKSFWSISWEDLPGLSLTLVAAWAIGSGTRSRRAYLDELRARAAGQEREQNQRAVLAVAAERARISRELHDIVAHGLSVMVVQAQGGAAALDNRPADTRAALDAIITTGRDSLADMRRVLSNADEPTAPSHPHATAGDADGSNPRPGTPSGDNNARGSGASGGSEDIWHGPGTSYGHDSASRRPGAPRRSEDIWHGLGTFDGGNNVALRSGASGGSEDIRRVLGILSEADDAWHPQPGLPRLPALIAQVREAGTAVRLRTEGDTVPLPSTVDLAAYRIVQEAITNTMKHAGAGAKVQVDITYAPAALHLVISDDGPGIGHEDGLGNGLRGMRERARLLGGRLDAGPGPGPQGFLVRAVLPIEERSA